MTNKQYKQYRAQYPDAVILERIEFEGETDIETCYAAYGRKDIEAVIEATAAPFYYDRDDKWHDGELYGQLIFDSNDLEKVVRGLTDHLRMVVFVH